MNLAAVNDISTDWKGSTRIERRIIQRIVEREATSNAIAYFARHCHKLSDYWYWFMLGTLWVSYSGNSDLNLWRKLFSAQRPNRSTSLMKPCEHLVWQRFPQIITAYRAHRIEETDWISYTLSPHIAARFARERKVDLIVKWHLPVQDVIAYFSRRDEQEIIVLDNTHAEQIDCITVVSYSNEVMNA